MSGPPTGRDAWVESRNPYHENTAGGRTAPDPAPRSCGYTAATAQCKAHGCWQTHPDTSPGRSPDSAQRQTPRAGTHPTQPPTGTSSPQHTATKSPPFRRLSGRLRCRRPVRSAPFSACWWAFKCRGIPCMRLVGLFFADSFQALCILTSSSTYASPLEAHTHNKQTTTPPALIIIFGSPPSGTSPRTGLPLTSSSDPRAH